MNEDLLNPRIWDRVYYTDPSRLKRLAELTEPAPIVRAVHAYFHTTKDGTGTLQRLEAVDAAPAQGLRLLALCQLGRFDHVLARGFSPVGATPLELEEAVYGEWALSMAHASFARHAQAAEHLRIAVYLAECLQLEGRRGVLAVEQQRQLSLSGRPNAAQLWAEVARCPSGFSSRFGLETYIEALLAEGRYDAAQRTAAQNRLRPGLLELCAALAQRAVAGNEATRDGQLAQAFGALARGEVVRGPETTTEPWATYVALTNVAGLMFAGKNQLARLKLPLAGGPDQQAWALGLAWALWCRTGLSEERTLALPERFVAALEALGDPSGVTRWLSVLIPDELTLLKLAGWAPEPVARALEHAPILQHGAVLVGSQRVPVPKKASQKLIRAGFDGERCLLQVLDRSERKRYRDPLRERGVLPHHVVNPGSVLRGAQELEQHARLYGRDSDQEKGAQTLARALQLLPDSVSDLAKGIAPEAA